MLDIWKFQKWKMFYQYTCKFIQNFKFQQFLHITGIHLKLINSKQLFTFVLKKSYVPTKTTAN